MKIYFVTNNTSKAAELQDYLTSAPPSAPDLQIVVFQSELFEVLDCDIDRIVTNKALDAFQRVGLPCVVEHSGLFMDALPGLPGGLGQTIWRSIGDRMCGFLRESDSRAATARSVIGYCDGRRVTLFHGEARGQIAQRAQGERSFNWDPIFIPDGSDHTYAEMGMAAKRATSPVYKAWDAFVKSVTLADHRPPDLV
jgi:XTP/dITP diphosphohydrolase